jgi:hypothetical protein
MDWREMNVSPELESIDSDFGAVIGALNAKCQKPHKEPYVFDPFFLVCALKQALMALSYYEKGDSPDMAVRTLKTIKQLGEDR